MRTFSLADDLEALTKSRALLKMLYSVRREDAHLGLDYSLWSAI